MEGLMAAPVSGVDAKYLSCLLLNLAFILKERITHKSIIIYFNDSAVESVQDFLIKLDMKPCMHLVEISIFH